MDERLFEYALLYVGHSVTIKRPGKHYNRCGVVEGVGTFARHLATKTAPAFYFHVWFQEGDHQCFEMLELVVQKRVVH